MPDSLGFHTPYSGGLPALHLEEEDLASMGLAETPILLVTMELETAYA